MKKRIFLSTLFLSMLLSGCVTGVTSSSSEYNVASPSSEDEKVVPTILLKQMTLDNMPSSAKAEFTSNGLLKTIEGSFVDFKIENEEDAFKAVASVSELMQCEDIDNELRIVNIEKSPANTVYSFRQYYNGLPVDGYITQLFVNSENNEIRRLKNSYVPDISINTTPTFTENDLKKIISDNYKADINGDPELEISFVYSVPTDIPSIVWKVGLSDSNISSVTVDAVSGKVLYEEGPQY